MRRRDFLSLGLGAAGLSLLSGPSTFAGTDKSLRMIRPEQAAFTYAGISSEVLVERRYHTAYPRIGRIEFRFRGNLVQTLTQAPYSFSWVPTSADIGTGDFTATAFQAGTGRTVWSASVNMRVAFLPPGRSS